MQSLGLGEEYGDDQSQIVEFVRLPELLFSNLLQKLYFETFHLNRADTRENRRLKKDEAEQGDDRDQSHID